MELKHDLTLGDYEPKHFEELEVGEHFYKKSGRHCLHLVKAPGGAGTREGLAVFVDDLGRSMAGHATPLIKVHDMELTLSREAAERAWSAGRFCTSRLGVEGSSCA